MLLIVNLDLLFFKKFYIHEEFSAL